jgi:hypothetical protein
MNGEGAVFFHFYFLHFIFESFYFCSFILFYLFWFLIAINLLMFVLVRKDCC